MQTLVGQSAAKARLFRTIDGGENWRPQRCESYYNLNSIYMVDAETGWIVGDLGVMLRYVVDD